MELTENSVTFLIFQEVLSLFRNEIRTFMMKWFFKKSRKLVHLCVLYRESNILDPVPSYYFSAPASEDEPLTGSIFTGRNYKNFSFQAQSTMKLWLAHYMLIVKILRFIVFDFMLERKTFKTYNQSPLLGLLIKFLWLIYKVEF